MRFIDGFVRSTFLTSGDGANGVTSHPARSIPVVMTTVYGCTEGRGGRNRLERRKRVVEGRVGWGGDGTHLLRALVLWRLATYLFRDGAGERRGEGGSGSRRGFGVGEEQDSRIRSYKEWKGEQCVDAKHVIYDLKNWFICASTWHRYMSGQLANNNYSDRKKNIPVA